MIESLHIPVVTLIFYICMILEGIFMVVLEYRRSKQDTATYIIQLSSELDSLTIPESSRYPH